MSYCRFATDSSVYVWGSDVIHCSLCELNDGDDMIFTRYSNAIIHLHDHRALGHKVPDRAFQQLEADQLKDGDIYKVPT